MKKLALLFYSCLQVCILIAQKDTATFSNVIIIKNENTWRLGNSYLIDIPLFNRSSNRIFYNGGTIPTQTFLQHNQAVTFLNLDSFTLIVSNMAYHKSVKENNNENMHVKGVPAYIVYNATKHFSETYGFSPPEIYFKYDSIKLTGFFKSKFYVKTTIDTTSDSLLVYYHEISMPLRIGGKVPVYAKTLSQFIKEFEQAHQVKIKNTYARYSGNNIAATYCSLEGLSPQQKLSFILQRKFGLDNLNDKLFIPPPGIYMPYYVDKQHLKLVN